MAAGAELPCITASSSQQRAAKVGLLDLLTLLMAVCVATLRSIGQFPCCRAVMRAQAAATAAPVLPYRVGHGFDLHRLAEGYKLIIGGVEIPHTKGCEAHSDGEHNNLHAYICCSR
jgi:hypothetical protein